MEGRPRLVVRLVARLVELRVSRFVERWGPSAGVALELGQQISVALSRQRESQAIGRLRLDDGAA